MKKTLVRFFGGAVMVVGTLVGLSTSARAQSIGITTDTQDGPTHQPLTQVIHVTNGAGGAAATAVKVTFWPPKGAKVDSACQVDHFPGGLRSYTCEVGTLTPGQTVDVPFSLSMTKSGDVYVVAEVSSDLDFASALFSIHVF
jgi:hypothetical protein